MHPPVILFLLPKPSSGYVWLDAANWFVRHPGDVLRALGEDPVHACLKSDVTRPGTRLVSGATFVDTTAKLA